MGIKVKLTDGTLREVSTGTTPAELVPPELRDVVIAARVNGEVRDLKRRLPEGDVALDFVLQDSADGGEVMRHSAAHILAGAVRRLFPGTTFGTGPAIENGFFYDMDTPRKLTDDDLAGVEKEMAKIVAADHPFERLDVPHADGVKLMKERGEGYKLEILQREANHPEVSIYRDGDFTDLCEGPHIPSTKWLRAFKLTKIAGAYWRGDEKNKMLTRVYGIAFASKEALDLHLRRIQEAKDRDHRRLGTDLELFSLHEEVGAGLVLWHPNATVVRQVIEDYWMKLHRARGYQFVMTPHITHEELYRKSGHLEVFKESMFAPMDVDGRNFYLKPMNCPHHIMIYKTRLHSYRELPIRLAEMGTVYRYEKPGVLHGMLRVRGFTIDDSHLFVAPDQLENEIIGVFHLTMEFLKTFGFNEFVVTLSTKPEKAVGGDADWEKAEGALKQVLEKTKTPYVLDAGGGAFYGPKISVEVKDCLGRSWQCSTVQLDFNLPERFDLEFIAMDGRRQRPYMIHRALMGSVERFFGVLTEHYAGEFPLWLAPAQAAVVTISGKESEYAQKVHEALVGAGLRSEIDASNDRIAAKIRDWTMRKVPYILVVGKREAEKGEVSVRERKRGDLGARPLSEVIGEMQKRVVERS